MKKLLFLVVLCIGSISSFAYASTTPVQNTGFVPANIWYSKDIFYAGETVRIYTIIFNGSSSNLSGTVEFLDNGTAVGGATFSMLGTGMVRDISVRWKATEGKHIITARIVNATLSQADGIKSQIVLENANAGESDIVVDIDPATKAAQEKAAATKVVEVGTQAAGTITNAIDTVGGVIPTPIKEGTATGVNALENLRTTLATQLLDAKENKGKEIDALNQATSTAKNQIKQKTGIVDTISNATQKPFAYVTLAIFTLLHFFFDWKILFYGALLYILYRLIKWIIHKIRDR